MFISPEVIVMETLFLSIFAPYVAFNCTADEVKKTRVRTIGMAVGAQPLYIPEQNGTDIPAKAAQYYKQPGQGGILLTLVRLYLSRNAKRNAMTY